MLNKFSSLDKRGKAIFIGLFLSKFGKKALDSFGLSGYMEAYNILGYSIGVPPLSIRGYRDEFDPYYENGRKGWHNRKLRDFCKDVKDWADLLSFNEYKNLVDAIMLDDFVDVKDIKETKTPSREQNAMFNRLITGKAAEAYFTENYMKIDLFHDYQCHDTTNMGCGFDFKLSSNMDNLDNYYVEVKGINGKKGGLLMTEKEYTMAGKLQERYCLFVVSNFKESPVYNLFLNPLYSNQLSFLRNERKVIQISYSISILNNH